MHRVIIGGLGCGEPAFVDAIVDGIIDAAVNCFDVIAQVFGLAIDGIVGTRVKRAFEHPVCL